MLKDLKNNKEGSWSGVGQRVFGAGGSGCDLHKGLKILMVVVLLAMAYFLPWFCVERGRVEKGFSKNQESSVEAEQESSGGEGWNNGAAVEDGEKETVEKKTEEKVSGNRGRIVLDPGHGGIDPGMVGVGGVEEKHINLQVAKTLGNLLEKQGFEVIYTRTEDVGLYNEDTDNKKAEDMRRRCELIEEAAPLLTVSVHQNSYTDASVFGPQVFYFEHSDTGEELAAAVQEQLNTQLEIAKPRSIKGNTNYYILKRSPGITILVECAFLSNPQEAEKIQTEEYQQAVARAICDGILQYLELGYKAY